MRYLVCGCGERAEFVTADHAAERPLWKPECTGCYDDGSTAGYTLTVADLEAKSLAWWLMHIGGKRWGARSDFQGLVGGLVGYCSDSRVVQQAWTPHDAAGWS